MRRLGFALGLAATVLLVVPAGAAARVGCQAHFAPTRITHRAPATGLLSRMAVLRRPQAPDDLPSPHFGEGFPLHLLARDYIRKAADGGGTSYYLVPASISYPRLSKACLRHLSPHRRRVEQRRE